MLQAGKLKKFSRRVMRASKRMLPWVISDALILLAAYSLTYSIRTGSLFFDATYTTQYIIFAIIVTVGMLYLAGAYSRMWSRTSGHEVSVIVSGTAGSFMLVLGLDLILAPRHLPVSVVIVSYLLALMGFVGIRYRSRLVSGFDWRWRAIWHHEFPEYNHRVLIVGAGEAGQITSWRLKHRYLNGKSGHHVVGYVDDDPDKHNLLVEGSPVLGPCAIIPEVTLKHRVDLIVFAIHNISGPRFREILTLCEQTSARIKIVPDVLSLLNDNNNAPLLRDVQAEDLLGRQPISWHDAVDSAPVSEKVVLVTGAAGSIGSELCRQMMKYHPVRLLMVDNNESNLHDLYIDLRNEHPNHSIVPILVDITHRDRLDIVFTKYRPQLVFHAAAYKHVPLLEDFPHEALRVNIGGTLNVAELAQAHHVERFVLISTDKAVNPSSVMGASKRVCELATQALSSFDDNATVFASVRFGNVLGSRGSVVPIFNRQIEAGGPVTVTDKDMVRYFMSIPEAVNLVIQAACLTTGNEIFILQMGEAVPIIELAERMIRLRGLRPEIDIPIEFTGVRPGEKLYEELSCNFETQRTTIHPDIMKLNGTCCNWVPRVFLDQVRALNGPIDIDDDGRGVFRKLTQLADSVFAEAEPQQDDMHAASRV